MRTKVIYLKHILMCSLMLVIVTTVMAQNYQAKHEVQRGETLTSIAKKYGVTEQMIKEANPQMGDLFYVGLKLNIPELAKQKANVHNEEYVNKPQTNDDESPKTSTKDGGGLYKSQYEQTAGLDDKKENVREFGAVGLGYWSYDGGENYGLQSSHLAYNGWATEFNIRAQFKKYGNYNIDLALFGYSFGLTEFDNGALYLALVAGPSIRMQTVYDWEDDKDKEKFFIDFYGAASLNFQLGERFLIKAGYNLWSIQFKFKEEYNADGVYFSLGYSF